MKSEDFDKLLQGIKEADAYLKGDTNISVRVTVIDIPDAKAIREKTGLSQSEFATLFGVSIKTLQNWEQKTRNPTGPARALLKVIDVSPETVIQALQKSA